MGRNWNCNQGVWSIILYIVRIKHNSNILLYYEAVTVDNAFYRCKIVFYTKTKYNTKKTWNTRTKAMSFARKLWSLVLITEINKLSRQLINGICLLLFVADLHPCFIIIHYNCPWIIPETNKTLICWQYIEIFKNSLLIFFTRCQITQSIDSYVMWYITPYIIASYAGSLQSSFISLS